MALGDKYRVAVVGLIQGQEWINVLHYNQITADGINTGTDAVASALINSVLDLYLPCLNPLVTLNWLDIQRIAPGTAGPTNRTIVGMTGTRTGTMLPSEVAAVVSKKGDFGGRSGRGRAYIPGANIADMVQATGYWTDGFISSLNSLGTAITGQIAGVDTATFVAGMWNHTTHVFTAVNFSTINRVPRVQRRRQIGRGI